MKIRPLVSIIVPMFKVEPYIEQCVKSLSNQTYENIEIICVNDGSPDNSSQIVFNLSQSDKRIRLLNKLNGGVSSARNYGIEKARGDFITFIDGDDYVSENYIETLLNLAVSYDSDFVFSTKSFQNINDLQTRNIFDKKISNEDALFYLLSPDVTVGCWNKIYKVSFLKKYNIIFNTELFYGEGLRFITSCAQVAKNVIVTNAKIYFYRRNNEFSATTLFNLPKYINGSKSLDLIERTAHIKTKKIHSAFCLHKSLFYLQATLDLISNGKKREYIEIYREWRKKFKENLPVSLFSNYSSFYRKCILILGLFAPRFLAFLNSKRKKRNSFKSV